MASRLQTLNFALAQTGKLTPPLTEPRQGLEVVNESPNGLLFAIPLTSQVFAVPPQHKRIIILPQAYKEIDWSIDYTLVSENSPANIAPVNVLSTQEVQDAIDSGSIDVPLSARQANIGNASVAVSSTPQLITIGNPPQTLVIQIAVAGLGQDTLDLFNDGSLNYVVMDANALHNILNVIAGTQTQNAQVVIGDPANPAMVTIHGTADNATQAGQAQTAAQAQTSRQITVYDGSVTNLINITEYQNTTDPSTYIVPNIGDRWYAG